MNGLVDSIALALAVRDTAERSRRQETERSRNDTGLVGNNVAEQVASDNDTVECCGVLDHDHGGGINKLVAELELRVIPLHDLGDNLPPQSASGENVGLVERPDRSWRVFGKSEVCGQMSDALNLSARVRLSVHCVATSIILLALAEVDAASQFADNVEVGATADLGLERRASNERFRGEEAGTEVSKGAHFLAELQKTLLGTDSAGAPFLKPCKWTLSSWRFAINILDHR